MTGLDAPAERGDVYASDVDVMLVEHLARIAHATEGMAGKAFKDGYTAGRKATTAVYEAIEQERHANRGRELARALVVLALVVLMTEGLARLVERRAEVAE